LLTQWLEENLGPPGPIHGYRSVDITPLETVQEITGLNMEIIEKLAAAR
jgi:hypothetical protein